MPHVEKRIYWLWCCLGVLLAGCGQAFTTTAARTPTLTLLSLPRPTISPTAILRLIRTTTASTVNVTLAPNQPNEPITPPACYENSIGSMWCLGLVQNNRDGPLSDIVVQVFLVDREGTALALKQITVGQHLLLAGQSATYGALFEDVPDEFAGPVAFIVDSVESKENGYTTQITAEHIQSRNQNGVFHIETQLTNHDEQTLSEITIFATTFNSIGHVTGYKQQKLDGVTLEHGASIPASVYVVPQGPDTTRVEISVEGWHK